MVKVLSLVLILATVATTSSNAETELCIASVHSEYDLNQGGPGTASGVRWKDHELVAAHKTIAFGRKVRVQTVFERREIIVRIIDRGPYIKGRCIDISPAVAKEIKCNDLCVVNVEH